jgi:hypothetical protein
MNSSRLILTIATVTAAFVTASGATAGEPKNDRPFTRPIAATTAPPDAFERYAKAHPYGRGLSGYATAEIAGEAKNDVPFSTPVPLPTSHSFHWRDASLGASVVGFVAVLAGLGLAVGIHRRRLPGSVGI